MSMSIVSLAHTNWSQAPAMTWIVAARLRQLDEHDRREGRRRRAGERATDDRDAITHQLGGRLDLDVHGQGGAGHVEVEHEVAGGLAEVRVETDGEQVGDTGLGIEAHRRLGSAAAGWPSR